MTNKLGPRCTAEYLPAARPLLAADASTRLGGRPVPDRDWRCVREPHTPDSDHLALPAGITGPSQRFAGRLVEPPSCPTCTTGPGRQTTDMVCQDCGTDYALNSRDVPAPAGPQHADPDDVRRLIELVQAPGTTAIHVNDGDELLLLLPDGDTETIERSAQALADLFPTVTFLLLAGVTGAVVMPRRAEPSYAELIERRDELIMQGVDPERLTMPARRPPILPLDSGDPAQA